MAIKIRKAEEKDIPCLLTLLDTIRNSTIREAGCFQG